MMYCLKGSFGNSNTLMSIVMSCCDTVKVVYKWDKDKVGIRSQIQTSLREMGEEEMYSFFSQFSWEM